MVRYRGVRFKVKETSYRVLLCLFLNFVACSKFSLSIKKDPQSLCSLMADLIIFTVSLNCLSSPSSLYSLSSLRMRVGKSTGLLYSMLVH